MVRLADARLWAVIRHAAPHCWGSSVVVHMEPCGVAMGALRDTKWGVELHGPARVSDHYYVAGHPTPASRGGDSAGLVLQCLDLLVDIR
jgi:hypothetical protein